MTIFRNFTNVTVTDEKFTEIIKKITEIVKDYFYTYIDDLGIENSQLSDYLHNYSTIYEDVNGNLHILYPVNKHMAEDFITWLENYDIVCVIDGRCSIDESNEPIVAGLLNQLLDITNEC